jgi:hypothetical protein
MPESLPLIAEDLVTVYESPTPANVYAYSPGIVRLPSGRLVVTMDEGGSGVDALPDAITGGDGYRWVGRVYTSDDAGKTWIFRCRIPLMHERPFVAGDALYIVGHGTCATKDDCGDLGIIRSDDAGETWGPATWLRQGKWHQAPCNVHYANGKVYLVMELATDPTYREWPVSVLAPVVMAAPVSVDLTNPEAWRFSNELAYWDAIDVAGHPKLIGVPFFTRGNTMPKGSLTHRGMARPGWLETHVVQFTDPDNLWHDPEGRTFYLWMRAHTGSTNFAAIAKCEESEGGDLNVSLAEAPSGEPMLYVPCPGGHLKFHILYDDVSKLFWLISNQATDSMTRPDRLPDSRYNLPNNERHRLVLHFSRNCVDWCFAGRVADTGDPKQARNYASMAIDGHDLHVLARSGDETAKSAHDGNRITLHTVKGFRGLVY